MMQKPLQMGGDESRIDRVGERGLSSPVGRALDAVTRDRGRGGARLLESDGAGSDRPSVEAASNRVPSTGPSCVTRARGMKDGEAWRVREPGQRNLRDMAWPDADGTVIGAPGGGCD